MLFSKHEKYYIYRKVTNFVGMMFSLCPALLEDRTFRPALSAMATVTSTISGAIGCWPLQEQFPNRQLIQTSKSCSSAPVWKEDLSVSCNASILAKSSSAIIISLQMPLQYVLQILIFVDFIHVWALCVDRFWTGVRTAVVCVSMKCGRSSRTWRAQCSIYTLWR